MRNAENTTILPTILWCEPVNVIVAVIIKIMAIGLMVSFEEVMSQEGNPINHLAGKELT
jgi:hypothetical protein